MLKCKATSLRGCHYNRQVLAYQLTQTVQCVVVRSTRFRFCKGDVTSFVGSEFCHIQICAGIPAMSGGLCLILIARAALHKNVETWQLVAFSYSLMELVRVVF